MMMYSVFTLILTALVVPSVAVPSGPVPSNLPNCFVCPPQDLAGRPLGPHSNSNSELFCRYQSVPNDFFCKYFLDTGLIKQDHDNGFCPPVAGVDCSAAKRRPRIPRSPAPPTLASRDVKARLMQTRNELGKKKRRG